ncbi:MAG: phage terminase large subunit family protein, partial [Thermaurantiacus tibetensis]
GQYRTARTPYMREIMDRLSPGDPAQRVVFMKAAQVGAPLALDTAALLSAPGRMVLGREQGPAGRPQLQLEGRVRPPGAALAAVLAGAPAEEPAAVGAAFAVALLGPLDVTPSSDGLVFRPRG